MKAIYTSDTISECTERSEAGPKLDHTSYSAKSNVVRHHHDCDQSIEKKCLGGVIV
jgi:hypothetical protein